MSVARGLDVNLLRAAYAVTTASRYALGAVAGCAAPLWCRVFNHGPTQVINKGAGVQCIRCGDWWRV